MCVGCRRTKPKPALVRLVRGDNGSVRVDSRGSMWGRGAYVCADPSCVERAIRSARLAHAFRKPCSAGTSLAEEVRGLWQQRRSR